MAEAISGGLSPAYQNLLKRAEDARNNAYTPNSHSNVGAAVLTSTGEIYTGANMELTTLADHAEQVAMGKAMAAGHHDIVALAIALKPGMTNSACGNCRQMMYDINPKIDEVFRDADGTAHVHTTPEELPDAYHRDHPFQPGPQPEQGVKDPLLQEAYIARSDSYAIRSQYPVGAAIQTADGKIFGGSQMEASSFPSAAARLAIGNAFSEGEKPQDIVRIALVGGTDGHGELPGNLSWDSLQALHNVAPQATVIFPDKDGVGQTTVAEMLRKAVEG